VATLLADLLFAVVAGAIAVAQVMIFRSTARALRQAPADQRTGREWAYAIVPAVALAIVLVFAWQAMHPTTIQVEGVAPPIGKAS
jgi:heme/copper-type cytochrome/quinol oxidase subunit 2